MVRYNARRKFRAGIMSLQVLNFMAKVRPWWSVVVVRCRPLWSVSSVVVCRDPLLSSVVVRYRPLSSVAVRCGTFVCA